MPILSMRGREQVHMNSGKDTPGHELFDEPKIGSFMYFRKGNCMVRELLVFSNEERIFQVAAWSFTCTAMFSCMCCIFVKSSS